MADTPHLFERRVKLLAGRLQKDKALLVQAIAPPGQRPPFTEQLSKRDALNFWRAHRQDGIGKEALSRMKPEAIMELDLALAQAEQTGNFPAAGEEY